MYPHRIRLRGPWECEPIGQGAPPARRVIMPARWVDAGLAGFRGAVRFVRKFGYPGKADPELEHIWLTCDGCTGARSVRLNSTLLSDVPANAFAFDVTPLMAERNQLEIDIDGTGDDAGLWGEVALEIRKDAYLADVCAEGTGQGMVVRGLVFGTAPRPLELYTLVDRKHVDYRTIAPTSAGTSFHIEIAEPVAASSLVRVELIHISEIWYIVEIPVSPWKPA